ncbi:pentatricopeptide repeat (PPR) superfamily protein [Wolffia australiana]
MEALVRKYQQKYRRVEGEMKRWDELQSRLISHFGSATSIIDRLEALREQKNYGGLSCVGGIKETLLGKQLETLERIFSAMKEVLKQFESVVASLDKISKDACQLSRSESTPISCQIKIGIKPSLADCVEGLKTIHEMYQSEYHLKVSLISALNWNTSSRDAAGLSQLLCDQPNIAKDEVEGIFGIVFAEES